MSGETKFRQDMPPPGGYRDFNFARTFPKMVWRRTLYTWCGGGHDLRDSSLWWFPRYRDKKASITEKFEDVDINNAMQPFLTAERDRYSGTWYGEPVYFTLGDKWWDPIAYEVFAHSDKYLMKKERYWSHHSDYAAPKFYDKWIPGFIAKYIW